ncbi:MAG TPA: hypothetical protein PKA56_10185, partial [Solirubrobacterales bacterium]|nr:hypothetical protein [Solirubrobacterales bacterium]
MHRSEDLTGEGRPDWLARGIGILPARIALGATMAVALFAALSFAPPASRAASSSVPQEPPMIL